MVDNVKLPVAVLLPPGAMLANEKVVTPADDVETSVK